MASTVVGNGIDRLRKENWQCQLYLYYIPIISISISISISITFTIIIKKEFVVHRKLIFRISN